MAGLLIVGIPYTDMKTALNDWISLAEFTTLFLRKCYVRCLTRRNNTEPLLVPGYPFLSGWLRYLIR